MRNFWGVSDAAQAESLCYRGNLFGWEALSESGFTSFFDPFRIIDVLGRIDLGLSLGVYQYTFVTKPMIVYGLQFLQYR